MTAAEKITKARAGLILDHPFFGSLALRLKVKSDETCKTAWTDGVSLGFNPAFIDGLPLDQVKGLLCHEVMHCACSHHTRRGARDPKKWNIAGDHAINHIITDCRMSLPEGALLDPAYKDMSADEIYGRLPMPQDQGGQGQGQGQGQSGQDPAGNDQGQGNDPGQCGEVRDAQGQDGNQASPADLSQAEQEWKIATTQAAQQARAMGKLSAGLARLVDEIVQPAVDWKAVLRRFVDQSAKGDYTWSRPNRRFIGQGLYLPSLHSEELKPLVIGIDTSGSIDHETLAQFAAEVRAILEDYKTSATVIYCDSSINRVDTFTHEDFPEKLEACGGGGTAFEPVFSYVDEHAIEPSCLVYLTDMYGSFPDQEPSYPVLWARIGQGKEAPFGETVEVKPC